MAGSKGRANPGRVRPRATRQGIQDFKNVFFFWDEESWKEKNKNGVDNFQQ
jgi:hypothetical protein